MIKAAPILLSVLCSLSSVGQPGMQVGQVLIVNYPAVKDGSDAAFKALLGEVSTDWAKGQAGVSAAHFVADRGKDTGAHLIACSIATIRARKNFPSTSPFAGAKAGAAISNGNSFTEYHLIGADLVEVAPVAGILGMHFIEVRPERAEGFEKFVVTKLHPAVSDLFPDMTMLYYKAVAGDRAGSYLTAWMIRSAAGREQYWPAGKPETALLKERYAPLSQLAAELETYLVGGSYLPVGEGAAAIFESKNWTDYVIR